jgi:hypothetical protein
MGGEVIFVFLVCLVYSVYLATITYEKKNKLNFLDKKDGSDERDEIDLLTGSEVGRGRAWTGPILSSLIITTGKKMLSGWRFH